eukprot:TRINITY_DN5687_c0_g1_i1.p1 TRINITY_DN5687_c0_g1~~TRINITY_DN5687_c0_g1_i1.p1  ORF type:complete len:979 (-),score=238.47 TRINITY_DN5687_c0_g1_i1:250-3186(-)
MGVKRQKIEEAKDFPFEILFEFVDENSDEGFILLKENGNRLGFVYANHSALEFLSADQSSEKYRKLTLDGCDLTSKSVQNLQKEDHQKAILNVWKEDASGLDSSFWNLASSCLDSDAKVCGRFDSKGILGEKIGNFLLEVEFNRCKFNSSFVCAKIVGHFHRFPMHKDKIMNVDEQQFFLELEELSNPSAQIIQYDGSTIDFLNVFSTPQYRRSFFEGMNVDNLWFIKDLGVDLKTAEDSMQELKKCIGTTGSMSYANPVASKLRGEDVYASFQFKYLDSIDKITMEHRLVDPNESSNPNLLHRIIISSEDVTEKTKAKIMTDMQKQLLNSIPSVLTMGELVNDGEDFLFHYCNEHCLQQIESFTGNKEDPIGKTAKKMGMDQEYVRNWTDLILRSTRETKKVDNCTYEDKKLKKYFSVTIWDAGNKRWGILCIDITDLKNMENELLKSKENLEVLVKARTRDLVVSLEVQSRFLATMSHEIRTPMSGIIGCLSHFSEMKDDNPENAEIIKIGKICSDQLLAVINDVLDFCKLKANEVKLDIQPVKLQTVIEESIDVISIQANDKNLPLIFKNMELPLGLRVEIDSGRFKQILINLLSNANKFTPEGEIVVTASLSPLGEDTKLRQLHVSVRDSGIGINKEFKEKMFEPFSQSDSSITRTYGGTGLGLSICKRLVNLMGGEIWVESGEQRGSTFHFTINTRVIEQKDKESIVIDSIVSELSLKKDLLFGICKFNKMQIENLSGFFASLGIKSRSLPIEEMMQQPDFASFSMIYVDYHHGEGVIDRMHAKCTEFGSTLVIIGHQVPEKWTRPRQKSLVVLRKPYHIDQLLILLDRFILGNHTRSHILESGTPVIVHKLEDLKILVAEDNILNQKVIQTMLKKMDVKITIVDNGIKAVEAAEKENFDVILMDCMMPFMGGIEATQLIRKNLPLETQPKIIALTADALLENKQACLKAGMDDVLTKPVKQDQLYKVLSQWI